MNKREEKLLSRFHKTFSLRKGIRLARAPGRVNLIGEHTDYNQGFVLPVAVDKEILMTANLRKDRKVILHSLNFKNKVEFSLDEIEFEEEDPWGNYPKGVFFQLQASGFKLKGLNGLYEGNIPLGGGLSSSAAIEVVTAVILKRLNELKIGPLAIIKLCQRAENEFVGVQCGIMDQFVSLLGKKNKALFLDCRTLKYELIPLNFEGRRQKTEVRCQTSDFRPLTSERKDVKIVIADTQVKRDLVSSEYNLRRRECEEGVKFFKKYLPGVTSLRDVSVRVFEKHKDELSEVIRKRCKHVVYENERVVEAKEALNCGDLLKFGRLLNQSHRSLKEDYQVSCQELDLMVEIASRFRGALGSRMTGAGFGGCTISLVKKEVVEEFMRVIKEEYEKKTGIKPLVYECKVVDGANVKLTQINRTTD